MSAETRRLSRERSKRFKKAKRKDPSLKAHEFERQDVFVPKGEKEPRKEDPFGVKQQAEAKKAGEEKRAKKAEAIQPTEPTPTEPVEEKKSWWSGVVDFLKQDKPMPLLNETPEQTTARLQGATLGGLIAGIPVAASATMGAITVGEQLISTGGLSNPAVASAATGSIGRLAKATKYISKAYPTTPLTTKAAKLIISQVTKITSGKKYQKAVIGIVSTTILNGFLEEEADQSVSFAIDKAIREGDMEEATEMMEFRKELTDKEMWKSLRLLIPLEGVHKYMQAARFKLAQQQRDFKRTSKALEEGHTPSPLTKAEREEEEAYYAEVERKAKEAKTNERKEEEAYWNEIAANRAADKAAERKADEEYWANIRAGNK